MAFTKIPTLLEWQQASRLLGQGPPRSLKPDLVNIDNVLDKYQKTFSDMAKRAVLTELYYALADWAQNRSGQFVHNQAMQPIRDLESIVSAELNKSSLAPHMHKYDKVVCIGLAIKTGKMEFLQNLARVEYQGYSKWYRSAHDNDVHDMKNRCEDLKRAIREAHKKYQLLNASTFKLSLAEDEKTLKIFMAPEFYFRGKHGAYDISFVSEILQQMRMETDDAKYKNWLFIFGTVIGSSVSVETKCTKCAAKINFVVNPKSGKSTASCPTHGEKSVEEHIEGATIDNVALIQKGGETGDANTYYVTKEFISSIDFRRPGYLGPTDANDLVDKTGTKISNWATDKSININNKVMTAKSTEGSVTSKVAAKFTDERMRGSIFNIDSITYGMEICLDHLMKTLQAGGAHHIQIQLIPSAGMNLKQFDCIANGIAFNVDGARGDADVQVARMVNPKVAAADSTTFNPNATAFGSPGKIVTFPPQTIPWPTDTNSFKGVVTHKPLPVPPPRLPPPVPSRVGRPPLPPPRT